MDEDAYFELLAGKFLTYAELSSVTVEDNGEPMVKLVQEDPVRVLSIDAHMKTYTGDDIYVRQSLVQKLRAAQNALTAMLPGCVLEVVYGYRHLTIQQEFYEDIRKRLAAEKQYTDDMELKEQVHHFIAVPEVAGHPTGGAVDIHITDAGGKPLDMGTDIHAFVKASYVHAPFISKAAWHNRQLLRLSMMAAGFAPYDGEWWHFSYGDREWAKYYGKPCAVYGQTVFHAE